MSKKNEVDSERRKALESGRGTKQHKKRMSENMTADYLEDRANEQYQKLKTLPFGTEEYKKLLKQWKNTRDKRYELFGNG